MLGSGREKETRRVGVTRQSTWTGCSLVGDVVLAPGGLGSCGRDAFHLPAA